MEDEAEAAPCVEKYEMSCVCVPQQVGFVCRPMTEQNEIATGSKVMIPMRLESGVPVEMTFDMETVRHLSNVSQAITADYSEETLPKEHTLSNFKSGPINDSSVLHSLRAGTMPMESVLRNESLPPPKRPIGSSIKNNTAKVSSHPSYTSTSLRINEQNTCISDNVPLSRLRDSRYPNHGFVKAQTKVGNGPSIKSSFGNRDTYDSKSPNEMVISNIKINSLANICPDDKRLTKLHNRGYMHGNADICCCSPISDSRLCRPNSPDIICVQQQPLMSCQPSQSIYQLQCRPVPPINCGCPPASTTCAYRPTSPTITMAFNPCPQSQSPNSVTYIACPPNRRSIPNHDPRCRFG